MDTEESQPLKIADGTERKISDGTEPKIPEKIPEGAKLLKESDGGEPKIPEKKPEDAVATKPVESLTEETTIGFEERKKQPGEADVKISKCMEAPQKFTDDQENTEQLTDSLKRFSVLEKAIETNKCFKIWDLVKKLPIQVPGTDRETEAVNIVDQTISDLKKSLRRSKDLIAAVQIAKEYFEDSEVNQTRSDEVESQKTFKGLCSSLSKVVAEHLKETYQFPLRVSKCKVDRVGVDQIDSTKGWRSVHHSSFSPYTSSKFVSAPTLEYYPEPITSTSIGTEGDSQAESLAATGAKGDPQAESFTATSAKGDPQAESFKATGAKGDPQAESFKATGAKGDPQAESFTATGTKGDPQAFTTTVTRGDLLPDVHPERKSVRDVGTSRFSSQLTAAIGSPDSGAVHSPPSFSELLASSDYRSGMSLSNYSRRLKTYPRVLKYRWNAFKSHSYGCGGFLSCADRYQTKRDKRGNERFWRVAPTAVTNLSTTQSVKKAGTLPLLLHPIYPRYKIHRDMISKVKAGEKNKLHVLPEVWEKLSDGMKNLQNSFHYNCNIGDPKVPYLTPRPLMFLPAPEGSSREYVDQYWIDAEEYKRERERDDYDSENNSVWSDSDSDSESDNALNVWKCRPNLPEFEKNELKDAQSCMKNIPLHSKFQIRRINCFPRGRDPFSEIPRIKHNVEHSWEDISIFRKTIISIASTLRGCSSDEQFSHFPSPDSLEGDDQIPCEDIQSIGYQIPSVASEHQLKSWRQKAEDFEDEFNRIRYTDCPTTFKFIEEFYKPEEYTDPPLPTRATPEAKPEAIPEAKPDVIPEDIYRINNYRMLFGFFADEPGVFRSPDEVLSLIWKAYIKRDHDKYVKQRKMKSNEIDKARRNLEKQVKLIDQLLPELRSLTAITEKFVYRREITHKLDACNKWLKDELRRCVICAIVCQNIMLNIWEEMEKFKKSSRQIHGDFMSKLKDFYT